MAFVFRNVYSTYSTLYCLNLNGAPALFMLRHAVSEIIIKIETLPLMQEKLPCAYIYIIVLMSACPINLFDPILLYLMPKRKRYSGRKARALFMLRHYSCSNKKQRPCFIVGEIVLWLLCKQCISMIQPLLLPIYKLLRLRSTSPTLAVYIKAPMLTLMQAMWLSLLGVLIQPRLFDPVTA